MSDATTCMQCGACCACFRVAFPLQEADALNGGLVPLVLTLPLDENRRVMMGTTGRTPRCAALEGQVGTRVRCGIYARRPTTCQDFAVDWAQGRHNPICSRARITFGLLPLEPY